MAWPGRRTTLTITALTAALWIAVAIIFIAAVIDDSQHLGMIVFGHAALGVSGALLCVPLYFASMPLSCLSPLPRVAALAFIVLLISAIQAFADLSLFTAIMKAVAPEVKMAEPLLQWRFNMLIYIWIYAFYATTIAMMLVMLKAQKGDRQLLQARAAADRARLDALRLQINPHFLFNALNAATSLVNLGRNSEAETVLLRLSDFFRSSLTSHPGDMVPLATEFDDLSAYLDIETVRFGRRLMVAMELPIALRDAQVPHFLLQPLVENAIKHGVAKSVARTTISVVAEVKGRQLTIRIENDEPHARPIPPHGTGVGLINVQERLSVIYGENARLETGRRDGRFWSQIDLPTDWPHASR